MGGWNVIEAQIEAEDTLRWLDDPAAPEWENHVMMRTPVPTLRWLARLAVVGVLTLAGWIIRIDLRRRRGFWRREGA